MSKSIEEILFDFIGATGNTLILPDQKAALDETVKAIEAHITRMVDEARIDELKKLPNVQPVWFDPKLHTSYIDDRLKQLKDNSNGRGK
jgi:hypothetical protein